MKHLIKAAVSFHANFYLFIKYGFDAMISYLFYAIYSFMSLIVGSNAISMFCLIFMVHHRGRIYFVSGRDDFID